MTSTASNTKKINSSRSEWGRLFNGKFGKLKVIGGMNHDMEATNAKMAQL